MVGKIKEMKGCVKVLGSNWKVQSAWQIEQTENLIVADFPLFKPATAGEPVDDLIIVFHGSDEPQILVTSYNTMVLGCLEQARKHSVKRVFMISNCDAFPSSSLLDAFRLNLIQQVDEEKIYMRCYEVTAVDKVSATTTTMAAMTIRPNPTGGGETPSKGSKWVGSDSSTSVSTANTPTHPTSAAVNPDSSTNKKLKQSGSKSDGGEIAKGKECKACKKKSGNGSKKCKHCNEPFPEKEGK